MRRWTTATSLELVGGELAVVKRRSPIGPPLAETAEPTVGTAADRVRRLTEHEATWLLAASGEPVLTVHHVDPAAGVLVTEFAGQHTLRTLANRSSRPSRVAMQTIAAVLADVASVVARLHRRGFVHGQLTLDHVILTGWGQNRPVLCSPAPPDGADGDGEPDPEADTEALAVMASKAVRGWERTPRRWRQTIEDVHARATELGPGAAAPLFASLAGYGARGSRRRPGRG